MEEIFLQQTSKNLPIFYSIVIIFFVFLAFWLFFARKKIGEEKPESPFLKKNWKKILLAITFITLGFRLWHINYAGLHIDESNSYLMAENIIENGKISYFSGERDLTSIDLVFAIVVLKKIFPFLSPEIVSRLPVVIVSTLTTLVAFALTKIITRNITVSLIAALFWAADPFAVFWGHYARFYSFISFYYFTALVCAHYYLRTGKIRYAIYLVLCLAGLVFSRATALLILPCLIALFNVNSWKTKRYWILIGTIIVMVLSGLTFQFLQTAKGLAENSINVTTTNIPLEVIQSIKDNLLQGNETDSSSMAVGLCAKRFFLNDVAALPTFMISGLAGLIVSLFYRKRIALIFATTSIFVLLSVFMFVTKCQIRFQWLIHTSWIIYSAIFVGTLSVWLKDIIQKYIKIPTAILIGLFVGVSLIGIQNLKTTIQLVTLRPGDNSPFYFYFSNSKHWVEDSRSPGKYVNQNIKPNDFVITSMWQYIAYFPQHRNQFKGVILMGQKPENTSAYVTGGVVYWTKEQFTALVNETHSQNGRLWVIYDQTKGLDPEVKDLYFTQANLKFTGADGKTQVFKI